MRKGYFMYGLEIITYPIRHMYNSKKETKTVHLEHNIQCSIDFMDIFADAYDTFTTGAGDIVVTDIIRQPELTAILVIVTDDNVSPEYKRKIKKDRLGHYIMLDGEKWYFHKHFKEFNITEEELM